MGVKGLGCMLMVPSKMKAAKRPFQRIAVHMGPFSSYHVISGKVTISGACQLDSNLSD